MGGTIYQQLRPLLERSREEEGGINHLKQRLSDVVFLLIDDHIDVHLLRQSIEASN